MFFSRYMLSHIFVKSFSFHPSQCLGTKKSFSGENIVCLRRRRCNKDCIGLLNIVHHLKKQFKKLRSVQIVCQYIIKLEIEMSPMSPKNQAIQE